MLLMLSVGIAEPGLMAGESCSSMSVCGVAQRHKKTGEAMTDENGKPLQLTSHTLAPVPVAIGGAGLPDNVIFRKDLPDAGLGRTRVIRLTKYKSGNFKCKTGFTHLQTTEHPMHFAALRRCAAFCAPCSVHAFEVASTAFLLCCAAGVYRPVLAPPASHVDRHACNRKLILFLSALLQPTSPAPT